MKKKSLMLVMLTLVLALGMSMQVSAKTKVKTYKVTYVLNGGTNNYIHRLKRDIFLRAGIQINIIETK